MFPITYDFSEWYAGRTIFALVAVLLLAIYSLRTAWAGRAFLTESFLEK